MVDCKLQCYVVNILDTENHSDIDSEHILHPFQIFSRIVTNPHCTVTLPLTVGKYFRLKHCCWSKVRSPKNIIFFSDWEEADVRQYIKDSIRHGYFLFTENRKKLNLAIKIDIIKRARSYKEYSFMNNDGRNMLKIQRNTTFIYVSNKYRDTISGTFS